MDLAWSCAGAIVGSVIGNHDTFVAGSLGAKFRTRLESADPAPPPEPDGTA